MDKEDLIKLAITAIWGAGVWAFIANYVDNFWIGLLAIFSFGIASLLYEIATSESDEDIPWGTTVFYSSVLSVILGGFLYPVLAGVAAIMRSL